MAGDPQAVKVAQSFQAQLRAADEEAILHMGKRWASIEASLQAEIEALANELAMLKEKGEEVPAWKLQQMGRYQSLLAQVGRELASYMQWAFTEIKDQAAKAQKMAQDHAAHMLATTAGPAIEDQIRALWDQLGADPVERLSGILQPGAPLDQILQSAYPAAVQGLTDRLLYGTAVGWNPRKTARAMLREGGLDQGLNHILLVARDQQNRQYRDMTRAAYQQSGLVYGYKRLAAKNERTCLACLALDGRIYPTAEFMEVHPQDRCTLIPLIVGRPVPQWETGLEWLQKQDPQLQRRMMGPGRYNLWKEGKIELAQLVTIKPNKIWGPSAQETPVKVLKNGGGGHHREPPTAGALQKAHAAAVPFIPQTKALDLTNPAVASLAPDAAKKSQVLIGGAALGASKAIKMAQKGDKGKAYANGQGELVGALSWRNSEEGPWTVITGAGFADPETNLAGLQEVAEAAAADGRGIETTLPKSLIGQYQSWGFMTHSTTATHATMRLQPNFVKVLLEEPDQLEKYALSQLATKKIGQLMDPEEAVVYRTGQALPGHVYQAVDADHVEAGLEGAKTAGLALDQEELQIPPDTDSQGEPRYHAAAGMILWDPHSGKFVLPHPAGGYGGYQKTWPKGTVEGEDGLQETAIREVWEETGFFASIVGGLGDYKKSTSVNRFYIGVVEDGAPWGAHWETEAVTMVGPDQLLEHLHTKADTQIGEDFLELYGQALDKGQGDWLAGLAQIEAEKVEAAAELAQLQGQAYADFVAAADQTIPELELAKAHAAKISQDAADGIQAEIDALKEAEAEAKLAAKAIAAEHETLIGKFETQGPAALASVPMDKLQEAITYGYETGQKADLVADMESIYADRQEAAALKAPIEIPEETAAGTKKEIVAWLVQETGVTHWKINQLKKDTLLARLEAGATVQDILDAGEDGAAKYYASKQKKNAVEAKAEEEAAQPEVDLIHLPADLQEANKGPLVKWLVEETGITKWKINQLQKEELLSLFGQPVEVFQEAAELGAEKYYAAKKGDQPPPYPGPAAVAKGSKSYPVQGELSDRDYARAVALWIGLPASEVATLPTGVLAGLAGEPKKTALPALQTLLLNGQVNQAHADWLQVQYEGGGAGAGVLAKYPDKVLDELMATSTAGKPNLVSAINVAKLVKAQEAQKKALKETQQKDAYEELSAQLEGLSGADLVDLAGDFPKKQIQDAIYGAPAGPQKAALEDLLYLANNPGDPGLAAKYKVMDLQAEGLDLQQIADQMSVEEANAYLAAAVKGQAPFAYGQDLLAAVKATQPPGPPADVAAGQAILGDWSAAGMNVGQAVDYASLAQLEKVAAYLQSQAPSSPALKPVQDKIVQLQNEAEAKLATLEVQELAGDGELPTTAGELAQTSVPVLQALHKYHQDQGNWAAAKATQQALLDQGQLPALSQAEYDQAWAEWNDLVEQVGTYGAWALVDPVKVKQVLVVETDPASIDVLSGWLQKLEEATAPAAAAEKYTDLYLEGLQPELYMSVAELELAAGAVASHLEAAALDDLAKAKALEEPDQPDDLQEAADFLDTLAAGKDHWEAWSNGLPLAPSQAKKALSYAKATGQDEGGIGVLELELSAFDDKPDYAAFKEWEAGQYDDTLPPPDQATLQSALAYAKNAEPDLVDQIQADLAGAAPQPAPSITYLTVTAKGNDLGWDPAAMAAEIPLPQLQSALDHATYMGFTETAKDLQEAVAKAAMAGASAGDKKSYDKILDIAIQEDSEADATAAKITEEELQDALAYAEAQGDALIVDFLEEVQYVKNQQAKAYGVYKATTAKTLTEAAETISKEDLENGLAYAKAEGLPIHVLEATLEKQQELAAAAFKKAVLTKDPAAIEMAQLEAALEYAAFTGSSMDHHIQSLINQKLGKAPPPKPLTLQGAWIKFEDLLDQHNGDLTAVAGDMTLEEVQAGLKYANKAGEPISGLETVKQIKQEAPAAAEPDKTAAYIAANAVTHATNDYKVAAGALDLATLQAAVDHAKEIGVEPALLDIYQQVLQTKLDGGIEEIDVAAAWKVYQDIVTGKGLEETLQLTGDQLSAALIYAEQSGQPEYKIAVLEKAILKKQAGEEEAGWEGLQKVLPKIDDPDPVAKWLDALGQNKEDALGAVYKILNDAGPTQLWADELAGLADLPTLLAAAANPDADKIVLDALEEKIIGQLVPKFMAGEELSVAELSLVQGVLAQGHPKAGLLQAKIEDALIDGTLPLYPGKKQTAAAEGTFKPGSAMGNWIQDQAPDGKKALDQIIALSAGQKVADWQEQADLPTLWAAYDTFVASGSGDLVFQTKLEDAINWHTAQLEAKLDAGELLSAAELHAIYYFKNYDSDLKEALTDAIVAGQLLPSDITPAGPPPSVISYSKFNDLLDNPELGYKDLAGLLSLEEIETALAYAKTQPVTPILGHLEQVHQIKLGGAAVAGQKTAGEEALAKYQANLQAKADNPLGQVPYTLTDKEMVQVVQQAPHLFTKTQIEEMADLFNGGQAILAGQVPLPAGKTFSQAGKMLKADLAQHIADHTSLTYDQVHDNMTKAQMQLLMEEPAAKKAELPEVDPAAFEPPTGTLDITGADKDLVQKFLDQAKGTPGGLASKGIPKALNNIAAGHKGLVYTSDTGDFLGVVSMEDQGSYVKMTGVGLLDPEINSRAIADGLAYAAELDKPLYLWVPTQVQGQYQAWGFKQVDSQYHQLHPDDAPADLFGAKSVKITPQTTKGPIPFPPGASSVKEALGLNKTVLVAHLAQETGETKTNLNLLDKEDLVAQIGKLDAKADIQEKVQAKLAEKEHKEALATWQTKGTEGLATSTEAYKALDAIQALGEDVGLREMDRLRARADTLRKEERENVPHTPRPRTRPLPPSLPEKQKIPEPEDFPADPAGLRVVDKLGGSTGAELVEDPATGKRYVRKRGNNPGHVRAEIAADQMYLEAGINVPRARLYETSSGPVKLAEFVEGQTLDKVWRSAGPEKRRKIQDQIRRGFALDALLGNWDVIGMGMDNIMVTEEGEVYRIDNGGSFNYRAQGQEKRETLGEDTWNNWVTDLWTMRDSSRGGATGNTARVLEGVDWYGLLEPAGDWLEKRDQMLAWVAPEERKTVSARLDHLQDLHDTAMAVRRDNYTSRYAEDWQEQGTLLKQSGLLDRLPRKLQPKHSGSVQLQDENGKPWDNFRGGSSNMATWIRDYIEAIGGDYGIISKYAENQGGNSWNGVPNAVKVWREKQRPPVEETFWYSGRDHAETQYQKSVRAVGGEDVLHKTLTAFHAFTFESLRHMDMARSYPDAGYMEVVRTESPGTLSRNGHKAGVWEYVTMPRGRMESGSLTSAVSAVAGNALTMYKVPYHRIFAGYWLQRVDYNRCFFYGDGENEVTFDLDGLPFVYYGSISSGTDTEKLWQQFYKNMGETPGQG